jgi:hypothetical protein
VRLVEEPEHARIVALGKHVELPSPDSLEFVGARAPDPVGLVEVKHGTMLWSDARVR